MPEELPPQDEPEVERVPDSDMDDFGQHDRDVESEPDSGPDRA